MSRDQIAVIAPTKLDGWLAVGEVLDGHPDSVVVAVVTPRAPWGARGSIVDRIVVLRTMLTHPRLEDLLAQTRPAMATRFGVEERQA